MPTPGENETREDFISRCIPIVLEEGTAENQDQAVAVCNSMWRDAKNKTFEEPEKGKTLHVKFTSSEEVFRYPPREAGSGSVAPHGEQQSAFVPIRKNTLKAVSSTDDILRVANYIVLFGGRDLEGVASDNVNADGSKGEFFTPQTELESAYTKSGVLYVDWEHGGDANKGAPGADDVLGFVDWSTAKADECGVWVERALFRHSQYVKWIEELVEEGVIGTSSEAIPTGVEKTKSGEITRWPLRRDTLTVTPMEPRMISENAARALKALGVSLDKQPEPEPAGPEPEDGQPSASEVGAALATIDVFLTELSQEE
jgi:hypothetical protein